MRMLLTLIAGLVPGAALAHPGHLAEAAGHDHLVAGVALGVAIGVAIWGVLKGRKDDEAQTDEADIDADEEPQEA